MKNVHILPTTPNDETAKGFWIEKTRDWCNIYITSDEEIKEGDFVIEDIGGVVYGSIDRESIVENPKKIILTSDPDLIADGIQAIDDEFLKYLVENPSCEWVEVKSKMNHPRAVFGYEIIVQKEEIKVFSESGSQLFFDEKGRLIKEEPNQEIISSEEDAKIFVDTIENPPAPNEKLKRAFEKQLNQETLEEAAGRLYPDGCDGTNRSAEIYRRIFIDGAKLQAERMYSEEEVIEHLNHLIMMPSSKLDKFTNDEEMVTMKWFEQFKKNKLCGKN